MSHSDSEVRDESKQRRKTLGTITKAKFRCRMDSNPTLKSRDLRVRDSLKPVLLELRLIRCVNYNNIEEAKKLLERGVSADSTDSLKRSALHIAVSRGYQEAVALLLKHGADPNIRDSLQNTPLHLAACSHNIAIIIMLINAGADVDLLDMHGRHPLHLAKSKLFMLQRYLSEGCMEMAKFKTEVKEIIDLMISVRNAKRRKNGFAATSSTEDERLGINNLENLINSLDEDNNIDYQMDAVLNSLQNFQIS